MADFVVCKVQLSGTCSQGGEDKPGPYLTPLGIGSIERGSFTLLGRFSFRRRRNGFLADGRFSEISILPPTDPTVVAQDATGKTFRCFPPLRRLSSLTRSAQRVAPWLLHERTLGISIGHGWGRGFRLPIGSAFLPDLSVDILEFRAVGSTVSQQFRWPCNAMTLLFPMAIIPSDFVDGSGTDLLADEAQFGTMLLDHVFENCFLLAVPVSIDPTSLILFPLGRGVRRRLL